MHWFPQGTSNKQFSSSLIIPLLQAISRNNSRSPKELILIQEVFSELYDRSVVHPQYSLLSLNSNPDIIKHQSYRSSQPTILICSSHSNQMRVSSLYSPVAVNPTANLPAGYSSITVLNLSGHFQDRTNFKASPARKTIINYNQNSKQCSTTLTTCIPTTPTTALAMSLTT